MALSTFAAQHSALHPCPKRPTLPDLRQPGSGPVGSSHLDVIKQALRHLDFTEPVLNRASAPIRDSSCVLYSTHWRLFVKWVQQQNFYLQTLSIIWLNTWFTCLTQVNKSTLSRSLGHLLSVPLSWLTHLLNFNRTLYLTFYVLWPFRDPVRRLSYLSGVLAQQLFSFKTVFLVALTTEARGSELVGLSRADSNLTSISFPLAPTIYSFVWYLNLCIRSFLQMLLRPNPGIAYRWTSCQ